MYKIVDGWMVFNHRFNESLTNVVFPVGIQKIRFGWNFNQDISQLPNSLTHLKFGDNFNQDVSQLPNSLTHLIFGNYFNQYVSQLPKSIISLEIYKYYYYFKQSLNPYLYHLIRFEINVNHKHKIIMKCRCKINKHNTIIRENNLIDLLLKN